MRTEIQSLLETFHCLNLLRFLRKKIVKILKNESKRERIEADTNLKGGSDPNSITHVTYSNFIDINSLELSTIINFGSVMQ